MTALVRKTGSLSEQEGLTTALGSPVNEADISNAISASPSNIDVVLVTLNARRVSDSPFAAPDPNSPPDFMTQCIKNVLSAMRAAATPIPKIVVMSAAGTAESINNMNILMRFVFTHTNMKFSREDHEGVDRELKAARDIKFVEVRPWMLTDLDAAEVKVFPDNGAGAGFMPKISRASVAKFMVEAAEGSQYDMGTPVITN